MSSNGGKRIHHLRPARQLSQVPRWEPSSEANGNAPPSDTRTAVSQAIVDLIRTRTGSAPATAKTEMASELAIVTLSEGLAGQAWNGLFQELRADAVAAVEGITGRQVAAYLTDQQHDPDLAMIAFVFGPRARAGSE